MVQDDVAPQGGIGGGAVGLVVVLPGPVAGALVHGPHVAAGGDIGVDQLHIAVIGLGLRVHQIEDPLGTGHGHDDGIDLV